MHYAHNLIGKTIAEVRHLDPQEMDDICWYGDARDTTLIVFTDGTVAIPMRDPEGNGTGHLAIITQGE